MSTLATAVCSITPTKRRRFFWAAWWTAPPAWKPFQKPDAASGGALTEEEALAEAERAAGRSLTRVAPHWALAYKRILRGEPIGPPPETRTRPVEDRHDGGPARASAWTVLGIPTGADADTIKRAYRKRALDHHPDRGGDPAVFRAIQRAYERLLKKADKPARKTR